MTKPRRSNTWRRRQPQTFTGPKGVCACGHTGNGAHSEHADTMFRYDTPLAGNGVCIIPGCTCTEFVTAHRTPEFAAYCNEKQHNVP